MAFAYGSQGIDHLVQAGPLANFVGLGRRTGEEAGVIDHDGAVVTELSNAPDFLEEWALRFFSPGVLGDAPMGIEPEQGRFAGKKRLQFGQFLGRIAQVKMDRGIVAEPGFGQLVIFRRQLDRMDRVEIWAGNLNGVTLEGTGFDEKRES